MLKLKKQEKKADESAKSLVITVGAKGSINLPELMMKNLDFKTGDKIVITQENGKISMKKTIVKDEVINLRPNKD
jgi:bifunctional DNA-binding transcriptional regulator/antitoxin component of YhaV-PrlF toxin-antitoxin module